MAKVNYVREHISFMEYAADEELTTGERLLWYALMHIFNRRARGSEWPDGYVRVNNRRLMLYCGMKYDTMSRARQALRRRGLIDYIEGERNRQMPAYRIHYFGEVGGPAERALDVPEEADCFGGYGVPAERGQYVPEEANCFGGYGVPAARAQDVPEEADCFDGYGVPVTRAQDVPEELPCFGGYGGPAERALDVPEEVPCDDWLWDILDDPDDEDDVADMAETGVYPNEYPDENPSCPPCYPQISDNMGDNIGDNMGDCPANIYINHTYKSKRHQNPVPEDDEEEIRNNPVDHARAREAVGPTGIRGDVDTDAGVSADVGREDDVEVLHAKNRRGDLLIARGSSESAPTRGGRRNGAPTRGMASEECYRTDIHADISTDGGREVGVGAALRRPSCTKRVEQPGGRRNGAPTRGMASTECYQTDIHADCGTDGGREGGVEAAPAKNRRGDLLIARGSSESAPTRGGRRNGAPTRGLVSVECFRTNRPDVARVAQVRAKTAGNDLIRRFAPPSPEGEGYGAAVRGLSMAGYYHIEQPEMVRESTIRAKMTEIDPARDALAESWMRAYGKPIVPAVLECLLSDGSRRLGRDSPLLCEAVRMAALRCADSPVDYIRALYRDWQARGIFTEDDLEAYLDGMDDRRRGLCCAS